MKRVAIVLTNVDQYGENPEKTGLWLTEATGFVHQLEDSTYTIDYISPKGGEIPLDPRSLDEKFISESDRAVWESADFQDRALKHSKKVSEVNPDDYTAIYYTGGHGAMWDFPDNSDLQLLAEAIYKKGGVISAVCQGISGLLNIRDANDNPLIADVTLTGYTKEEEALGGKKGLLPFSTEVEAQRRGANFIKKAPFTPHAVRDGRIITGQNPMSGGEEIGRASCRER